MKTLILGGTGQIGNNVKEYFIKNNVPIEFPQHSDCDVLNEDSIFKYFYKKKYKSIINCTGLKPKFLECENINPKEIEEYFKLNVISPMLIVKHGISSIVNNGSFVNISSTTTFLSSEKKIIGYKTSKVACNYFIENTSRNNNKIYFPIIMPLKIENIEKICLEIVSEQKYKNSYIFDIDCYESFK